MDTVKLDEVLKELYEQIDGVMVDTYKLDTSYYEYLVRDGYAINGAKRAYGDDSHYAITQKGIHFYREGGYVGRQAINKQTKSDRRWKRTNVWIDRIAPFFTGVAVAALTFLLQKCCG